MANQAYEMIKGIAGIEEMLVARKFPFPIIYGPERIEPAGSETVVLFMRDRLGHEAVKAAAGTGPRTAPAEGSNPATRLPKKADRMVGVECRIYARANVAGANPWDHEELCDYLTDGVITAIVEWCEKQGAGAAVFSECRYMTPEELVTDKGEPLQYPGVVYLIRYQIGRGVYKRTFEKLGSPIGLIAGVSNQVDVRLKDSDPPETVGPF